MNLPKPGDYINIHTHGVKSADDVFTLENLMAHEEITPENIPEQPCSFGIHPWYLNESNFAQLLKKLVVYTRYPNLFAVGEAGFDKLRGPSPELQKRAFEAHVTISEEVKKPVIVHCVRAWGELISEHRRLKPKMPWLVHGFRGSVELANQLLSRGMYFSFWFDFVIRPESAGLLKTLPAERIFLETDGADIDIRTIYGKVASDLDLTIDELKSIILKNFNEFFRPQTPLTLRSGGQGGKRE